MPLKSLLRTVSKRGNIPRLEFKVWGFGLGFLFQGSRVQGLGFRVEAENQKEETTSVQLYP